MSPTNNSPFCCSTLISISAYEKTEIRKHVQVLLNHGRVHKSGRDEVASFVFRIFRMSHVTFSLFFLGLEPKNAIRVINAQTDSKLINYKYLDL
jgi:hypothetical protein